MGRNAMRYLAMSLIVFVTLEDGNAASKRQSLVIPEVVKVGPRLININDMASLRRIDCLTVSPDGERFAIFVRQGDPVANDFRTGWFVGDTKGSALTYVGDGGDVRLRVSSNGRVTGSIESQRSQWSPDGKWIAYTLRRDGKVQLWRSRSDGSVQEQITRNAADVQEFAWSENGQSIYFTVGTPRNELHAREEAKARSGYRYDKDLYAFTDFMLPQMPHPLETDLSVWVVTLKNRHERLGGESERIAFKQGQARHAGGIEPVEGFLHDSAVLPVARADGALTWLERTAPTSRILRVVMSRSQIGSDKITCADEVCSGVIQKVWWSEDGQRIFFWRREGIGESGHGFYAWSPSTDVVSTVLRARDDQFERCDVAGEDRLVCVRETPTYPQHVVAIDMRSGKTHLVADVNPEFSNIRLGKVERFEWDTPKFSWSEHGGKLEGVYPKRAYGYILFPPDFDPARKYPVIIEPYAAYGFDNLANLEHPLHVYAANGFIVLNTQFPMPTDAGAQLGAAAMKRAYSAELGFPHLSMYMESTIRALDVAAARGFIDDDRVGIGGVSHGSFVPLYMMQKHDRIAAISISGGGWGPFEYYWSTLKGRSAVVMAHGQLGYEDWKVKPEGQGREFWRQIDLADHIDTVEAPILMNLAASETYGVLRLIRHLADAGKPYDAFVFENETHIKWQPAHLYAIMNRNLDWFRFWLQEYEDPDPTKAAQYRHWRNLRERSAADHVCAASDGDKHACGRF